MARAPRLRRAGGRGGAPRLLALPLARSHAPGGVSLAVPPSPSLGSRPERVDRAPLPLRRDDAVGAVAGAASRADRRVAALAFPVADRDDRRDPLPSFEHQAADSRRAVALSSVHDAEDARHSPFDRRE